MGLHLVHSWCFCSDLVWEWNSSDSLCRWRPLRSVFSAPVLRFSALVGIRVQPVLQRINGYQAHLPDFIRPLIFALGTIAANPEGPADGVVTFPLAVFDFVRGGMKECTLRYVLSVLVLTADPAS